MDFLAQFFGRSGFFDMTEVLSNKTALALIAALGYALATFLMKLAAGTPSMVLLAFLAIILMGTVSAEIFLLRQVDLGLAYIAIIATETLLVLCYAFAIGEGLSGRELLGGVFVIAGVALVSF